MGERGLELAASNCAVLWRVVEDMLLSMEVNALGEMRGVLVSLRPSRSLVFASVLLQRAVALRSQWFGTYSQPFQRVTPYGLVRIVGVLSQSRNEMEEKS